jgi:hypothetical protein
MARRTAFPPAAEIVHDDDVARLEGRDERPLDIEAEPLADLPLLPYRPRGAGGRHRVAILTPQRLVPCPLNSAQQAARSPLRPGRRLAPAHYRDGRSVA